MKSNFWTLTAFEYKKIFRRKATWFMFGLALLAAFFFTCGSIMGWTYVDGEKSISHYEQMLIERDYDRAMKGPLTGDVFAYVIEQNQLAYADPDRLVVTDGFTYPNNEQYEKYIEPYRSIQSMINHVYAAEGFDYYAINELVPEDGAQFYERWEQKLQKQLDYGIQNKYLSEKEAQTLSALSAHIQEPLQFDASEAYSRYLSFGNGIAMVLGLVIIVCIAPIFSGEYQSGCDALILSSKEGKKKAVHAKIFTALSFSALAAIVYSFLILLAALCIYGFDGGNASFQLGNILSFYPLTLLQGALLLILIIVFACVFTAALTLCCSALIKNSFAVTVPMMIIHFVPAMLSISVTSPIFRLINLFPTRMVNIGHITNLSLYNIFGLIILPPVFYLLFSILGASICSYFSGRKFRSHQIG